MKPFTKDEYLAAPEAAVEWVPLPHLGDARGLYIRAIAGDELDDFQAERAGEEDTVKRLQNLRARLVALCACDVEGKRLFEAADAAALGRKAGGGRTLQLVFDAARRLNRIMLTDAEEKELEKNSILRNGSSTAA